MNTREDIKHTLLSKNDEDTKKVESSMAGFFLKNKKFSWVIFVGVVLLGILSIKNIPVELQPEIKIKGASVSIPYLGASPSDIENLILEKIEDAVENLDDVDEYNSTASIGIGTTVIQFTENVDLTKKVNELKTEIDKIKGDLPTDAEDPIINEFDFGDQPIIITSLLGANYSQMDLYRIGEKLQKNIESIKEVSKVSISGGQKKAFRIIVDPQKLEDLDINMSDVATALSSQNFNFSLGNIKINDFYYSVTQDGELKTIDDISYTPVKVSSGRTVMIQDIAKVKEDAETTYGKSTVGQPNKGIKNSISLMIYKKEGGSILDLADNINQKIEESKYDDTIPQDVEVFITRDLSEFIRDDFTNLTQSALLTLVIVFVVLLWVGWKEAIIASISVPMSFFITFIALDALGYTLNNVTLFSLILSLGLLVDTAIVIIEGCHDYINQGYKGTKAALLALRDYQSSLISGTLTTVAAFVPMLFMTGTVGQFIRVIPLTISIVLISSLFVALTFNTLVASVFLKPIHKKDNDAEHHPFQRIYVAIIKKIMINKTQRGVFITTCIGCFLFSTIIIGGSIPIEFFPQSDLDYFSIQIEAPKDIDLKRTLEATQSVENILLANPYVESFTMDVGSNNFGNTNKATAEVTLKKDRKNQNGEKVTMLETIEEVQKLTDGIQGVKIIVDKPNIGPPVSKPINIRIIGKDFSTIENVSKNVLNEIKNIPGVSKPDTDIRYGAGSFTVIVDREKAIEKGLSPLYVAQNVRTILQEREATQIRIDGEEVAVIVEANEEKIQSINDIENLVIVSPMGQNIRVKEVSTITLGSTLSSITRRNGEQLVQVYSFIDGENEKGKNFTSNEVLQNIQQHLSLYCLPQEIQNSSTEEVEKYKKDNNIQEYCTPENVTIEFGGEEEESAESFASLGKAGIIGIILIIGILVLQFNSYSQPFIVMTAILLGLIGVFPGLKIVGATLSFPTFIGIASLSGIAVNDAIILVSRINQNRESGMKIIDAITEAGVSRWKPIIITTLSTAGGLFPLVFVDVFYAYLAWAIIFGICTATVLSMFFVPVLYYAFLPKMIKKQAQKELKI